MGFDHTKVRVQRLITARFTRLPLQRADLAFDFLDDVADAQQICFCCLEFAQRLPFLRFIFCDSGSLFENGATIFRARAQDQVDLPLFHH